MCPPDPTEWTRPTRGSARRGQRHDGSGTACPRCDARAAAVRHRGRDRGDGTRRLRNRHQRVRDDGAPATDQSRRRDHDPASRPRDHCVRARGRRGGASDHGGGGPAAPQGPAGRADGRLRGRQRRDRARRRVRFAGRRPLRRGPSARGVLRHRGSVRRLPGRARATGPRGGLADDGAGGGQRRRRASGDLARPAARVACGLLGGDGDRTGHRRRVGTGAASPYERPVGRSAARARCAATPAGAAHPRCGHRRLRWHVRDVQLRRADDDAGRGPRRALDPRRARRRGGGHGRWDLDRRPPCRSLGHSVPGRWAGHHGVPARRDQRDRTVGGRGRCADRGDDDGDQRDRARAAGTADGRRRGRADARRLAQPRSPQRANALGAWLGGLVITAGLGYRAPALVGVALAAAGLAVLALSLRLERGPRARSARSPHERRHVA